VSTEVTPKLSNTASKTTTLFQHNQSEKQRYNKNNHKNHSLRAIMPKLFSVNFESFSMGLILLKMLVSSVLVNGKGSD